MEVRPDPTRGVGFRQECCIAGGASDGKSELAPAAESANAASSAAPVAHQTAGAYPHPQRKVRTPHHRQRLFRGRNVEGARLRPRGKRIEVTPRCERPQLNDRTLRSQFSSSQFLVPGSWFLVPGSWFLVLGSWFSVLVCSTSPCYTDAMQKNRHIKGEVVDEGCGHGWR